MSKYLTSIEVMLQGLRNENKEYLNQSFLIKKMPGRGRSVFTTRTFKKGNFVMEYKGTCKKYYDNEYTVLQDVYQSNSELSYCLEFTFQGQKYFIDATREFGFGVARLINHARNPNVKLFRPMQVEPGKLPRIAMFAATNIAEGEELFWDYFSS